MTKSNRQQIPHWVQTTLGWTLLSLVGISLVSSGLVLIASMAWKSAFWTMYAQAAIANCLFLFAVCLALIDLSPIKRILLFSIIPMVLFGCLVNASRAFPELFWGMIGPPVYVKRMNSVSLLGPLLSMACASSIWLIRIQRGWRISRIASDEMDDFVPSKKPELIALVSWAVITYGLYYLGFLLVSGGNGSRRFSQQGIMIPVSILVGASFLIVLPITYRMMKTRWPLIMGVAILTVFPGIVLATFIGIEFSEYSQSGVIDSQRAMAFAKGCFVTLLFPVLFFWGLRLIGYRLIVPHLNRIRKRESGSVTHPLDD